MNQIMSLGFELLIFRLLSCPGLFAFKPKLPNRTDNQVYNRFG